MVSTPTERLHFAAHGANTGPKAQAEDHSLQGIDPLCASVDEYDVKIRTCNCNDEPWHPRPRTKIGHSTGCFRNDLDERERVGDDILRGNWPERAHALGLSKDAKEPRVGTKLRHGDDPSG